MKPAAPSSQGTRRTIAADESLNPICRPGGEAPSLWAEATVDRAQHLMEVALQPGVSPDERVARAEFPASYSTPATRIVRLTDALVETRMCVALKRDGRYVPDTLRDQRQATENGYRTIDPATYEITSDIVDDIRGDALLVGLPCGGNYFHWLFEAVVRFLAARESCPSDVTLLVPPLRPMERDALLFAGASQESLYELPRSGLVSVENLVVAPRGLYRSAKFFPGATDAINALSRPGATDGIRLYVSRGAARRRRIANEDAVVELVRRYGFTDIAAEKLSVEDQVRLFERASAVITNHGGGLTNVVFLPPGAAVLELQPEQLGAVRTELYWNLAATRGVRYAQIVCRAVAIQDDAPPHARDIEVDCRELEDVLDRTIGQA